MIPGWCTELAASQRITDLRSEAEHRRLLRSGHHDGESRRLGWVHWHGRVSRIRAARVRSQQRASWPDPQFLTQRGDRS
jgi:hypothetical protein